MVTLATPELPERRVTQDLRVTPDEMEAPEARECPDDREIGVLTDEPLPDLPDPL